MTDKLSIILEHALTELDKSNMWFNEYENSGLDCDWKTCMEHDMKCRGLLDAYEIMTGKKIYPITYEIKEELPNL